MTMMMTMMMMMKINVTRSTPGPSLSFVCRVNVPRFLCYLCFLHNVFQFFQTNICVLNKYLCFLHHFLCFLHKYLSFFTQTFVFFYTNIRLFLHIHLCSFTQIFVFFTHFLVFYTIVCIFVHTQQPSQIQSQIHKLRKRKIKRKGNQTKKGFPINFLPDSDGSAVPLPPQNPAT